MQRVNEKRKILVQEWGKRRDRPRQLQGRDLKVQVHQRKDTGVNPGAGLGRGQKEEAGRGLLRQITGVIIEILITTAEVREDGIAIRKEVRRGETGRIVVQLHLVFCKHYPCLSNVQSILQFYFQILRVKKITNVYLADFKLKC